MRHAEFGWSGLEFLWLLASGARRGTAVETADQLERIEEAVAEIGGGRFQSARSRDETRELWRYRHKALPAAKALRAGGEVLITDVCVPISRLADCIVETQHRIGAERLLAPIVGHVGDGNFHAFFVIDPADHAELARVHAIVDWITEMAIGMDGTCTGEHGIGLGKREALIRELGATSVDTMRQLKRALDSRNILNPGKIFSCDTDRFDGNLDEYG